MIGYLHSFPEPGAAKWSGRPDDAVRFTLAHQLLDKGMWARFIGVFRWNSDSLDDGWRCEFWGKTMRGGCLTYQYTGDEALYGVLTDAVKGLLSAQRPDGSFTTYPPEDAFRGWDVWGRKYVLTGLMHYYRICRDGALKRRVRSAMLSHARRLFSALGPGKREITRTSGCWGGVNSCSVLEPVAELYKLTGDPECRAFAEYILSTGGCSDGDLIALAAEDRVDPCEYPEVKAYETISFFEGLLAMYEATEDRSCLDTVEKFAARVRRSDITAIGCAGCTHELFDRSALRQTLFSDGIMQETCVTVTWMRFNARLFMLTGKTAYFDEVERSAYNALYGAMNTEGLMLRDVRTKDLLSALPFDSYSPLVAQPRGRGVGGLKYFREGGFYGCCACIASAGTALLPLLAVTAQPDGISVNTYLNGEAEWTTPAGQKAAVRIETDYPAGGTVRLRISTERPERFAVRLRIPAFLRGPAVRVNGADVPETAEDGRVTVVREWNDDTVSLEGTFALERETLNGKTAFFHGPLTLARDETKEENAALKEPLALTGEPPVRAVPGPGETVRYELGRADGGKTVLTEYASCGKRWDQKHAAIGVWSEIGFDGRTPADTNGERTPV